VKFASSPTKIQEANGMTHGQSKLLKPLLSDWEEQVQNLNLLIAESDIKGQADEEKAKKTACGRCLEGLFDFFTFVVFTADVTLDFLITLQFYQLQRMTFFWISIALFFCSQIAYSMLFVMVFSSFFFPSPIFAVIFVSNKY